MTIHPMRRLAVSVCVAAFVAAIFAAPAPTEAQTQTQTQTQTRTAAPTAVGRDSVPPPETAAVVVHGDTLLTISGRLGSFTAAERADAIETRVRRLIQSPPDSLQLVVSETSTDIVAGDLVLMSVGEADAVARGIPRAELAEEYRRALQEGFGRVSLQATLTTIGAGLWRTLVATIVLLLMFALLRRGMRRLEGWVEQRRDRFPSLRIKSLELLPAGAIAGAFASAIRALRFVLIVLLLYAYVPLVLTFFPWTERYADQLLGYVLGPLLGILRSIATYLPNVIFIAVIVVITRWILKAIRLVFDALGRGTLTLGGFEREWADPTYNIVRFLVVAFVLVVVFPYLPGANSEAFKGVSLFLGVLISFGSSSAIANAIAGVVLTYTRAFRIGDRIAIGETVGDVTAKTLLVTRVRTIKCVEVTIPNAMVLTAHVQNFSTRSKPAGLILHTGVTIGYDAPWRQVHELLIAAAKATPGISATPAPFVLQTSLSDFYVSYELNAYTAEPAVMAATYSRLHENIQDGFNAAGVEIMSPHYAALRDGNAVTVPGTAPPEESAFRVRRVDGA